MTSMKTVSFDKLGIPVRAVSFVQVHPWRDDAGQPHVLITMMQDGGRFFVHHVNVATGEQWQTFAPSARSAGAVGFLSVRHQALFISSNPSGHLFRYDLNTRAIEDLGLIEDKPRVQHAGQIDEAADGSLYLGTHDSACLIRYEPDSRTFTRFGRADEVDHYFYPRCGEDGTVAGLVQMCFPHVVVLDPATGKTVTVGPTWDRDKNPKGYLTLHKAADGLLYLDSSEGIFRIHGTELTPVDAVPKDPSRIAHGGWGGTCTLPDLGITAKWLNPSAKTFRQLEVTDHRPVDAAGDAAADAPVTRAFDLTWHGEGTSIYKLHRGPDDMIYGSSILPEHLFRCDLDGAGLVDLGVCSVSTGEAYTMGNLDGKLYICSYPHARLSEYDPTKPYVFGQEEGANPRDLGSMHPGVANRPVAMVVGPAGKVWVGAAPDYGQWGGTLSWFDPKSRAFGSHRHITQDGSVVSLCWLPGVEQMLVGTTVWAGSGAALRAYTGEFVLWDVEKDEKTWSDTFGLEPIDGVYDLCYREADGFVYAVVFLCDSMDGSGPSGERPAHAEVLRLDMKSRELLDRKPLPEAFGRPLEWALQIGPDGSVWGVTRKTTYRIVPGSADVEQMVAPAEGEIHTAGPIVDGRLWFGQGSQLCRLPLVDA